VALLGLAPTAARIELPADLLVNNDLTIAASFGYTSASFGRLVGLLNEERIRPGCIVTHRFPLEDHAQAFAALAAPEGARGKILLEISGEL
jgi:threonine dehydrogenase-like Zn-dependent dehydrogenase